MRAKIPVAIVISFILGMIVISGVRADDWPTFHHDEARTGSTTSLAPNQPVLSWNKTFVGTITSSPAVSNGKVFVGCSDAKVYAFDADAGTQLWSNSTDSTPVQGSPTVARLSGENFDRVYVTTDRPTLYCFNASNGDILWSLDMTTMYGHYPIRASPSVENGFVYMVRKWIYDFGYLFYYIELEKINATSGAIVSRTSMNYGMEDDLPQYSSTTIYAGRVYAGYDKTVRCLDASDLTEKWSFPTGGHAFSTPAYYKGRIYFGSADNRTYAVNSVLGTEMWNYTTGTVFGSPAVANDVVFVGSDGAPYCVYALNSTTGVLIWYHNMTYPVKSSPSVADGKVFIGTLDGKLLALNCSTGQEVWSYDTATFGEIWSSPAIANGVIYFGSSDNHVYALRDSIAVSEPRRDPDTPTVPAQTEVHVFINATASQGINAILSFWINTTDTWKNKTMSLYDSEIGGHNGAIDGQQANTLVKYKIFIIDRFGNFVIKQGGSFVYTYIVVPEFPSLIILPLFMIFSTLAVAIRRTRIFKKPKT